MRGLVGFCVAGVAVYFVASWVGDALNWFEWLIVAGVLLVWLFAWALGMSAQIGDRQMGYAQDRERSSDWDWRDVA